MIQFNRHNRHLLSIYFSLRCYGSTETIGTNPGGTERNKQWNKNYECGMYNITNKAKVLL